MKSNPNEIVMCCFCGESLAYKTAIQITISTTESDKSQGLFAHSKCLINKLDKSVPIGIDIENK